MKLRDIARLLSAEAEGDGALEIHRVAKIEEAGDGDITFLANPKYAKYLASTRASAVIVSKGLPPPGAGAPALLRVDDPYLAFLKVLQLLEPPRDPLPPGIHATAIVAASAVLGTNVRVGAYVGNDAMICHGVVLGDAVEIGAGALLYPHVTVREGCMLGARTVVHSGTVIGSDGFGFAPKTDGTYEKIPQRGIVVVEDDVEIGANCAIDRATIGETRIKKGAKLDNLIQVAHNVVIGENTVIAAQAGVSGSTRLGNNCMVGGQVGFTGHLTIADHTKIGAQSGVHRSIAEAGKTYFGSPAYPHREAFRMQGALTQLPELLAEVRRLKEHIERLEKELPASPATSVGPVAK
jgi:UDP-3-O-[3-hydroxymyristoyl] glucosamine N-acyltransferase